MVANCIEMKREGWGDYRLNRIVKIRVVKLCFKFFDSKRLFRVLKWEAGDGICSEVCRAFSKDYSDVEFFSKPAPAKGALGR